MDGTVFTFNGIGEYVLFQAQGLIVQVRLQAFSRNNTSSVVTSIVVKKGQAMPIQITAENDELKIYIGGVERDLVFGDPPIIVDRSGEAIPDQDQVHVVDQVIIMIDNTNAVVISTPEPEAASFKVSFRTQFLEITMTLPWNFMGQVSGLLGVSRGNHFLNRAGRVLNLIDEEDIYHRFGLDCK